MGQARRYQPPGAKRGQPQEPESSTPSRSSNRARSTRQQPPSTSSSPPSDDVYLGVLNGVLKEAEARYNGHNGDNEDDESRIWCICRRKVHVAGSVEMFACEDPDCTIVWYHDLCLSSWERELATRLEHWICGRCFDTRRGSTSSPATTKYQGVSEQQTLDNSANKGQASERVPQKGQVPKAQNAQSPDTSSPNLMQAENQNPYTSAEGLAERPDQMAVLQMIKKNKGPRPRDSKFSKEKLAEMKQPNSNLTMEEKMAKVDALHRERSTWFWSGENDHKDTFVDTETGLRRILPQVGGGQVFHNFANDLAEQKRVSLEAAARRVTNLFTHVEKGSGMKGVPIFRYQHGKQ